jgi:ribosomal protein S18 acetylase RimI-like enzyme
LQHCGNCPLNPRALSIRPLIEAGASAEPVSRKRVRHSTNGLAGIVTCIASRLFFLPMAPRIRTATVRDAQRLAELSRTTFTETFGHLYPPEDLSFFLERYHSTEAHAASLADAAIRIWLAEDADDAIAYAIAGPCKLPLADLEARAGEVRQLYVLAGHHDQGLGTRLLRLALDWLDAGQRHPVYVGVWSENLGAQRFYARFGFERCGEYGFPVGRQIDREFIFRRR